MQWRMGNEIHEIQTVTLFKSIGNSETIDRPVCDFENADQKVAKIKRLC